MSEIPNPSDDTINYDGDTAFENVYIYGKLYYDYNLSDNQVLSFGNNKDLKIFHDEKNSYIQEMGVGNITIQSNNQLNVVNGGAETLAQFNVDGGVLLFYDDTRRLDTHPDGVKIYGSIIDVNDEKGSAGQVLSSNGTNLDWINTSDANVGSASAAGINLTSNSAETHWITFVESTSGNEEIRVDHSLTYKPSIGSFTGITTFEGLSITGGVRDNSGALGIDGQVLTSTGSAVGWTTVTAPAEIKGYISFEGNGTVIKNKNLTVSRTAEGEYTITLDASIQDGTSNYGVVISNVSDKRWTGTAPSNGISAWQPQEYNCWLESRSDASFSLRAREFTHGGFHRTGGDDEWSEAVFDRSPVDPDDISVIIF